MKYINVSRSYEVTWGKDGKATETLNGITLAFIVEGNILTLGYNNRGLCEISGENKGRKFWAETLYDRRVPSWAVDFIEDNNLTRCPREVGVIKY